MVDISVCVLSLMKRIRLKMISKFLIMFVIFGALAFDAETTVKERLNPFTSENNNNNSLTDEGASNSKATNSKPHGSATTTNVPETPSSDIFQQLEDQLFSSLKSSEDVFSFLKHGTFLDANASESAVTENYANTTAANQTTSSELGKHINQVFGVFKSFLDAFSSPVLNSSEEIVTSTPENIVTSTPEKIVTSTPETIVTSTPSSSVLEKTPVPYEADALGRSFDVKNPKNDYAVPKNQLQKDEESSVASHLATYLDLHYENVSACHQKVDPGLCRAFIPKWYFDPSDHICKKFIYGGCHGNKNNFEDENICYATCTGIVPCKTDPAKVCRVSESPCKNVTCVGNEDVQCILRPCTCEVYFVDPEGQEVNCSTNLDEQSDLSKAGDVADQDLVQCPQDQEKICHMSGSGCEHLTCPEHPDARCTMLPCTCETVFKDEDGLLVNCNKTLNESLVPSGKDSTNKDHSVDFHRTIGLCRKLGIGLTATALVIVLILSFVVGCYKKRRAVGSYSLFSNLSGSLASLRDRQQKGGFAEYTTKKPPRDDSFVSFQEKV